jgi:peptidoglycan hydrolase-like protein with peptidoglycan-binding domain
MAALITTAVVIAVPTSASAAAFGTRTLKQGMSGSDVKTAQKLLVQTGQKLTADGQFGPATKKAVVAFETAEGLDPDGQIAPDEASELVDAASQGAASSRQSDATTDPATGTTTTGTATTPGTTTTGATTTGTTTTPGTTTTTPATGTTTTPATGTSTTASGGALPTAAPTAAAPAPGSVATLNADGTATAPADAPVAVQQIIAAGNEIASKPYKYGGGHNLKWKDTGFDCSGSVSYALHGAGLLDTPLPSGNFETWGDAGQGQWVTLYANGGHMYMIVAGLRFDTSGAKPSRWQTAKRSSSGFVVRHPEGL